LYNRSDLSRARANLRRLGFEIKLGRHVLEQHGYLAGDDAARAEDFLRVWCDPEVDGVLCLRGGYGCARIVERLDYEQIAAHPKVFVGYSDVTALHLAIGRRANLVTFYGPMLRSFVRPPGSEPSYTERGFVQAVREARPLGMVDTDPDDPWVETITGGTIEGELVGGCLSLLASAVGTADDLDWAGKIVFLEDVNEEPYTIDGHLVHLLRAGKFAGVAGIVVGEHAGVGPGEFRPAFPSTLSLEDVIDDLLRPLGVPTIYGLPLGHGQHLATLPLGVRARLDADAGRLEILEAAVEARTMRRRGPERAQPDARRRGSVRGECRGRVRPRARAAAGALLEADSMAQRAC
jgi:muramoyltetrapeptide carboxypeptidase